MWTKEEEIGRSKGIQMRSSMISNFLLMLLGSSSQSGRDWQACSTPGRDEKCIHNFGQKT
jgi:hypothetical protein